MALTALPKAAARDNSNFALRQQPVRKGCAVQTGPRDLRKGIKRAFRLKSIKSNGIQSVDDQTVRRSYSWRIRSTSGSHSRMATMPISWAMVGADMIRYWWIL